MGNLWTYFCKSSEEKKPVDDITPEQLAVSSEQVPTENEIITVEEETTPIKVSKPNEYEVEFVSPTSMVFDVDERLPKFVTVPSSSPSQLKNLKIEQAATIC